MIDHRPALVAPMRIEAATIRLAAPASRVVRVGMGADRASAASTRLSRELAAETPVVVLGVAGGFHAGDRPGDVIVATEVRMADDSEPPRSLDVGLAEDLGAALERKLGRVRLGPIVSSRTLVLNETRAALGATGATCCDMESAWLAPLSAGRPFAVVRVILDSPGRELFGPFTVTGSAAALWRLGSAAKVVGPALSSGSL